MEVINLLTLQESEHGNCPHCKSENDLTIMRPKVRIEKWCIYKCEKCGEFFKHHQIVMSSYPGNGDT